MFIYSFYAFFSYYKHVSIVDSLKNRTNKGFKALRLQNTKKNQKNFQKSVDFQIDLRYYNTRPCENDSFTRDHPSGCGGIGRRARFRF